MISKEYMKFVESKECSPELIKQHASVNEMRWVHVGLGLPGDYYELKQAVYNDDLPNIKEELGDIIWYQALGYVALEWEVQHGGYSREIPFTVYKNIKYKTPREMIVANGNIPVGIIPDLIKKLVCYRKPNKRNEILYKIQSSLDSLDHTLIRRVLDFYQLDYQEIIHLNMAKLDARYREGFTAEECFNRDLDKEQEILSK
jgi:hypothetical protein